MAVVVALTAVSVSPLAQAQSDLAKLEVIGVNVTPHLRATEWKWSRPLDGPVGAHVQLFVQNTSKDATTTINTLSFDNDFPLHHMLHGKWAWSDTPNEWPEGERAIPPGALTVWSFNAIEKTWGGDAPVRISAVDWSRGRNSLEADFAPQEVSYETISFTGDAVNPTSVSIHVENDGPDPITLKRVRLWLPNDRGTYRLLYRHAPIENLVFYPQDGIIPPDDQGIIVANTEPLPLTYAAVETTYVSGAGDERSIWGHVRIRPEVFDISAGWINGVASDGNGVLTHEPFLKTLKRFHVNAAYISVVPGYNDAIGTDSLYDRYPIKFIGRLRPFDQFDTTAMVSHIHGADFLGEPQLPFGGHLPQTVLNEFLPYRKTRIPTTVTLSDERTFRYYAGLSDYPHCDAYRVNAPSADSWRLYDWDGKSIGWGGPLETIGELCRVLRELSRPMPTAAWSQGPHAGWGSYGGRERHSPTPDELLSQAYHVLSTRVTSFYWFNPSLEALVKFRDTIDPLTRFSREMRMLENFYINGAAYDYSRQQNSDSDRGWDLASIVAPEGAVLFAIDLDYTPDHDERVFKFGPPRPGIFQFRLPAWLRNPANVFRVDADGTHDVEYDLTSDGIEIRDTRSLAGVYVVAADEEVRSTIDRRHEKLVEQETALAFDPANDDDDFAVLQRLAE